MWFIPTVCLIFGLFVGISYKIEAKTYYFNLNKTNNEFMIYNRVKVDNSVNSYSSKLLISELRNNVTRKNNESETQNYPTLDPEWDYDWKNVTRDTLPPYIYKLYDSVSEDMSGSIRILFNSMPQNLSIIRFNLTDVDQYNNVSDVELHFFHSVNKSLRQKSLILRLYQVENSSFNSSSAVNPDAHKLLNVIYILQADSGWQIFKLTNRVQNWFNESENRNLLLFITVSKPYEDQFSLFRDTRQDSFKTFLILQTSSESNIFHKYNEIKVQNNSCQKHDLYIDFEKLNWLNFIIAPAGYHAFTCNGRCYKSDNLSNYLKITSTIVEFGKKSLCCVPVNYSHLPIMFYDSQGNIVIKVYHDMIVSACDCR